MEESRRGGERGRREGYKESLKQEWRSEEVLGMKVKVKKAWGGQFRKPWRLRELQRIKEQELTQEMLGLWLTYACVGLD